MIEALKKQEEARMLHEQDLDEQVPEAENVNARSQRQKFMKRRNLRQRRRHQRLCLKIKRWRTLQTSLRMKRLRSKNFTRSISRTFIKDCHTSQRKRTNEVMYAETNVPYPNRIAIYLAPYVGRSSRDGPLGTFNPQRDLQVYVDGALIATLHGRLTQSTIAICST